MTVISGTDNRRSRPLNLPTSRNAEADLFVRWQRSGDADARERLVHRYLPLTRKLARRYVGANEPIDDLIQVASYGLVKAIDRFDVSRGAAFTSFAVPTILGELRRYFRDSGWSVHVPRGAQERALRVEQAVKELTATTGREPRLAVIAEFLECSLDEVIEALEASAGHHSASLDAPAHEEDGEGVTVLDQLGDIDAGYEMVDVRVTFADAMSRLPESTREVIHMRFVEDLTQAEIGQRLGVSQMQISRILRSALVQIRAHTGTPT
jgi:RNA polymerase sigma-B factor